jgi:hypothetical protein
MSLIQRSLLVADSNGTPVLLPGQAYTTANTPAFVPHYKSPARIAPGWLTVSPESTGNMYVELWRGGQRLSDPVLLTPGLSLYTEADTVIPVAVRRAGELWLMSGAPERLVQDQVPATRPNYRGLEVRAFPVTQIPLVEGSGALSNIWTHPLCAPGSATPMVSGVGFFPGAALNIFLSGYTAAHWTNVGVCAFNVVRNPLDGLEYVDNVRRLVANTSVNNVVTSLAIDVNPWDRLGVIALPSTSNPGGVAPATMIWTFVDASGVYSRKLDYAYGGVGSGSPLV